MKRFVFAQLYLSIAIAGISQPVDDNLLSVSRNWDVFLSLNNQLLLDDYTIGTQFGVTNSNRNISFFAEFDIRPFKKRVLQRQSSNLYYQLSELRFYTGVGGEYILYKKNGNIGLFIQPSMLYTWGEYSGTELEAPNGWLVLPKMGLAWQFHRNGFLKAGFGYLDDKTERENRTFFTLQFAGLLKRSYD